MAEQVKTLVQSAPLAATLTALAAPGTGKSWAVSSIFVANRSATATSFRISIAKAAAGDSVEQYIYYDIPIGGNDTFVATVGIGLEATDIFRVYATLATLSFTFEGVEIS